MKMRRFVFTVLLLLLFVVALGLVFIQLLSEPEGPQSEQGEPGLPGSDGSSPHLYGVNGTDLGMVVSFDGSTFFLFVPGPDVILKVRSGGGIAVDTSHVFYSIGPGCTGEFYTNKRTPAYQDVIVYLEQNPFNYRYFVETYLYTGFFNEVEFLSFRRSGGACEEWPGTVNNVYTIQEVFLSYDYLEAYPPLEVRFSDY